MPTARQRDCTAALTRALDDVLRGYSTGIEDAKKKLREMSSNLTEDAYIGREIGRVIDGERTTLYDISEKIEDDRRRIGRIRKVR